MIDCIFVLADQAGKNWWTGAGFIRNAAGDPNEVRDLMQFRTEKAARDEATRMYVLTEIYLQVVRVRLLVGEVVEDLPRPAIRRAPRANEPRIVLEHNGTCSVHHPS